jgi:hypothetical protein
MLQCCNIAIQSVDPLPKNRFHSVNADFVQNFSDSGKKFICRSELLSLDAIFEMSKQENKKTRKQENKKTRKQENKKTRKQEDKKTRKVKGS